MMDNRKILVLGIDGMDQETTDRMVREGKLPNIKKFVTNGAAREHLDMLGAVPTITPPCWTTLATGTYPGTHGITCYWKQAKELDAVVYNMDSRNCKAEQIWNVTAEAGKKTLVWHWPGSSWPPTSNNENLTVIDGTQPGSVNMGISQMDWEKLIVASKYVSKLTVIPKTNKQPGVGCIIDDVQKLYPDEDNEMMELWWGDAARDGREIRTYVHDLDDTEIMIGAKVAYDALSSPIAPAERFPGAPEGCLEFPILLCNGLIIRYGVLRKNEFGEYDTLLIFKERKYEEPIVILKKGQFKGNIIDDAVKDGRSKSSSRCYKLIDLAKDGSLVKLWISNALDISNDTLWSPKSFYQEIVDQIGTVPPVSLIGGEDIELVKEVFLPSWKYYNQWQADCLKYAIDQGDYKAIFSHLHNVDCAGHQFWHLAKNLEPWKKADEKTYRKLIEEVYIQTDKYLGNFLPSPNSEIIVKQTGSLEASYPDVKVTWIEFTSGADILTAIQSDSIDMATIGTPPGTTGIANGNNFHVYYIEDIIGESEGLIVRNDSGISSLKELKGKKIATSFGTTSHFSLLQALKQEGIDPSDVKLIDMDASNIYAAWERGDIDGAYIWESVKTKLLVADGKEIISSEQVAEKGDPTAEFGIVRDKFYEEYPQVIRDYIDLLDEATTMFNNDQEKASKIISGALGLTDEETLKAMGGVTELSKKDQLTYIGTTDSPGSFAGILKTTADFLYDQGNLTEPPDLEVFQNAILTELYDK